MINYYQPFLLPFLRAKKYLLPKHIKRHYYHSFEDGLWELLYHKKIPQGALIFIPDFYCMDVIENIKAHGYRVMLYRVDKHFQIELQTLLRLIRKLKPQVVFLFHACGISFSNLESIITKSDNHILFIEDCVHRLVNPQKIQLYRGNHVLMDSLRKDSPLPGSFLYGTKRGINFPAPLYKFTFDTIVTNLLFFIFRFVFILGYIVNNGYLTAIAHTRILKQHDDVIGDSKQGSAGIPWIPLIHQYFNFAKIEKVKDQQARRYQALLMPIIRKSKGKLYSVCIPEKDYKNLHVYPLGLSSIVKEDIIHYLHAKNIIVWAKFADCPWSKRQKVLFLPLGFHVSDKDIEYTAKIISSYA